jgi:hypothetical protein
VGGGVGRQAGSGALAAAGPGRAQATSALAGPALVRLGEGQKRGKEAGRREEGGGEKSFWMSACNVRRHALARDRGGWQFDRWGANGVEDALASSLVVIRWPPSLGGSMAALGAGALPR